MTRRKRRNHSPAFKEPRSEQKETSQASFDADSCEQSERDVAATIQIDRRGAIEHVTSAICGPVVSIGR
jgi:hypothetical protein